MRDLTKNSEIIQYIFNSIIQVVSRRTTEYLALEHLHKTLKNLEPEYDFLKYIEIDRMIYSEDRKPLTISEEINYIESDKLGRAFNEIIDYLSKAVDPDQAYFVLREIKDELKSKLDVLKNQFGLDFHYKLFEQMINIKEEDKIKIYMKIKNSEVLKIVILTVSDMLSKDMPKENVIETLQIYIKNLESEYDFLKYIKFSEMPNADGHYDIITMPELDNILSVKVAGAVQKFLEEISKSPTIESHQLFLEDFKNSLGPEDLSKITKIGVKLDQVVKILQQQQNEILLRKTIETLIDLMSENTSKDEAVTLIKNTIETLKEKHNCLQYIAIDKSKYVEGQDAIYINPEVNTIESYQLGKAIRDIIKSMQDKQKDLLFIGKFKKKLGSSHVEEIEKMGINLHFIEMR